MTNAILKSRMKEAGFSISEGNTTDEMIESLLLALESLQNKLDSASLAINDKLAQAEVDHKTLHREIKRIVVDKDKQNLRFADEELVRLLKIKLDAEVYQRGVILSQLRKARAQIELLKNKEVPLFPNFKFSPKVLTVS